jgi:hypothetical protein
MNTTSDAADAPPTTVAFVNCFDATTFDRTVYLTPDEERRLRKVLAALRDYGFVLAASFKPALPGYGFADVAAHLHATIGSPIANAAGAAAERSVPGGDLAPAAVVPVWPFEPEGGSGDALFSSARLLGHRPAGRGAARRGRRRPRAGAVRAVPVRPQGRRGEPGREAEDGAAAGPRRLLRARRRRGARLTAGPGGATSSCGSGVPAFWPAPILPPIFAPGNADARASISTILNTSISLRFPIHLTSVGNQG